MHKLLRGAVAAASGLALTMTVTVATELPASAAPVCVTTFTHYKVVHRGSRGTQARAAECLLRWAGYNVRPNGRFTASDARRLRSFQSSRRLRSTGAVDSRSWAALLSRGSRPTLRFGSRGVSVKRLQRSLTATGRPVSATGFYGPVTVNAVKSYQRSRRLTASGTTTAAVWRALQGGGPIAVAKARVKARTVSTSNRGARALAFAKRQVGDRYRFGATGPNAWDCSGLTGGSWKAAGVRIPRTSQAQFRSGRHIAKSQLRPGDLVFFYRGISHVAIYAGNGNVIHASRPGKPVGYLKMKYMPFMGARRPG